MINRSGNISCNPGNRHQNSCWSKGQIGALLGPGWLAYPWTKGPQGPAKFLKKFPKNTRPNSLKPAKPATKPVIIPPNPPRNPTLSHYKPSKPATILSIVEELESIPPQCRPRCWISLSCIRSQGRAAGVTPVLMPGRACRYRYPRAVITGRFTP